MTVTVVAQVVDRLGTAAWYWTGTFGGRHMTRCEAHPAANFLDTQPGRIPIELRHHGKILGHVDYLEHGVENHDLRAVATLDLDDDLADMVTGLYCSADISGTCPSGSLTVDNLTLNALALVDDTAGVAARPVTAFPGDYRHSWERQLWSRPPRIIERAAKAVGTECRYNRPKALRIVRPTGFEERCAAGLEPLPVAHRTTSVDNERGFVRPAGTYRQTPYGLLEIEYSAPYAGIINVR